MIRAVALSAVLVVAAAACRGDDPAGSPDTNPPQTAVATTAAPTTTPATLPPATTTTSTTTTSTTVVATTTTTEPLPPLQGLALEVIADVARPLFLGSPPGDPRLFILEREGRILIYDPELGVLPEPFLDIRTEVGAGGIEQGLLGLAFHPQYAGNGRFFLSFTDRGDDTRIVELTTSADANRADPASMRDVLFLEQPGVRHQAGMIEFGPDGYLYAAIGDGGTGGSHGQQPDTLFGTILRLDVDGNSPYAIPPDNPFVEGGGAPEVWAYGLRNPWRFSIDPVDELIYIADVGQDRWEEVNVVPLDAGGSNFGWLVMEGAHCFSIRNCDPSQFTLPVIEHSHDEGCSITGGYVYRGRAIPELVGHYFYSDWCGEWLRSFKYEDGAATETRDWSATTDLGKVGQVDSFGVDGDGELYLATWEGTVARIVPVR